MKSQIRCESKHNWMKKREIPAAKRNKDGRETDILCTVPVAAG